MAGTLIRVRSARCRLVRIPGAMPRAGNQGRKLHPGKRWGLGFAVVCVGYHSESGMPIEECDNSNQIFIGDGYLGADIPEVGLADRCSGMWVSICF